MTPQAVIQHAESQCKAVGARLTTKRKQILELLLLNSQPLSAYELADLYEEKMDANIPAMSVYRMLDFLIEHKLVHKLSSTNKFIACAHITCDHSHQTPQFLICDRCHAVSEIDVDHALIDALEQSIADRRFTLTSPQLELHGICEQCQTS